MIEIIVNNEGREPNELDELRELIQPKNIYDDVAELQEQVGNIGAAIGTLAEEIAKSLKTVTTDLNNKNLDEQIGKLIIGYGNACINRPTDQNGYLINIPHNSAPERYGKQIWITRPTNNVFIRNLDDGTWSDWAPAYYSGQWYDIPLSSGVTEHNASAFPCRYRRMNNVVYLEGAVAGFAEVEKIIATIPAGYRPNKSFYIQVATNAGKTDTLSVSTTGEIKRVATTNTNTTANDYHFLNMSFLID